MPIVTAPASASPPKPRRASITNAIGLSTSAPAGNSAATSPPNASTNGPNASTTPAIATATHAAITIAIAYAARPRNAKDSSAATAPTTARHSAIAAMIAATSACAANTAARANEANARPTSAPMSYPHAPQPTRLDVARARVDTPSPARQPGARHVHAIADQLQHRPTVRIGHMPQP